MQVSLENLEGLERRLTVVIPKETLQSAYQKRINEHAKKAKIDGFRPGKVPAHVLEKKYGKGVLQEVAQDLIQQNLQKAIEEKDLKIAGMPNVSLGELKKDEPLEFKATFDVYPEIVLNELNGKSVEKDSATVTDADVDAMIEKMRAQHSEWVAVDREAKEGDKVKIDFEGSIEGEAFEGGKAEGFELEIGSKKMIPGFEEGVLGNKVGSEFDIRVPFPDDYPAPDLAGKDATFKIKVHAIEEPKLPALDDKLAEKMGIKEGLDALKKKVRNNMEKELERLLQAKLKENTLDVLVSCNENITIPKALVDTEIEHLQKMTLQQMAMQQGSQELPKMDLPREPFEEKANKRVILGLLLAELIKKYELKVDQDKLKAKVEDMASTYQKPEEVVQWYMNNKQVLSEIEAAVLEDIAVEKLLESATIKDSTKTYEEVVNSQQK